jgi:hypothetical protein
MLNFILAPLGIMLIGFGAVGLYWALRKRRARKEPDVIETNPSASPTLPDDS